MTKLIITLAVTMFFLASCNTEPKETVKMVSTPKEKSAKEKQQEIARFDAELEKSTQELQKQQDDALCTVSGISMLSSSESPEDMERAMGFASVGNYLKKMPETEQVKNVLLKVSG